MNNLLKKLDISVLPAESVRVKIKQKPGLPNEMYFIQVYDHLEVEVLKTVISYSKEEIIDDLEELFNFRPMRVVIELLLQKGSLVINQ